MAISQIPFLAPLTAADRRRLGLFTWLPAILLNLGSACLFGVFYALMYAYGSTITATVLTPGGMQFWLSVFIFVVEWSLAIALLLSLKPSGITLRQLVAPQGSPGQFRWLPAILLFVTINALMLLYMLALRAFWGSVGYEGLAFWQRAAMILLIPITAAFCEEVIWRGYILPAYLTSGKRWRAILIAAISFSLIHGVFLPDKLLMTFIFGILTGYYYTVERNLLPLFITHWFVDFWSYGWLLFIA